MLYQGLQILCGYILSKDYAYPTYIIIGKPYQYTTPLYIKYKGNHFANSKDCETLKAAKLVYSTSLDDYIEEQTKHRILEGGSSYQALKKILESKRTEINCKRTGTGVRIIYNFIPILSTIFLSFSYYLIVISNLVSYQEAVNPQFRDL